MTLADDSSHQSVTEEKTDEFELDGSPLIVPGSETPRYVQLPRTLETPPLFEKRYFSQDSRSNPLEDVMRWLGSSDISNDHIGNPSILAEFGQFGHEESMSSEYELGDRVVCRNSKSHTWQKGVVKSLHPLRVMPEACDVRDDAGYIWKQVQRKSTDEFDEGHYKDKRELLRQMLRPEGRREKSIRLPQTPFRKAMLPHSPGEVNSDACQQRPLQTCSVFCSNSSVYNSEEEEWNDRQQQTGSIGRLVEYTVKDDPRNDVLLRGGMGCPFVVANVTDGGRAQRVGVRAGDRLVSINGEKHFASLTTDELRESDFLKPPTLLVFLGFVGKLQAEVRLGNTAKPLGIAWNQAITTIGEQQPSSPIHLGEEVVIDSGSASIFMAVPRNGKKRPEELFEVHHSDARACVRYAMGSQQEGNCKNNAGDDTSPQLNFTRPQQNASFRLDESCSPCIDHTPCIDQVGWTPRLPGKDLNYDFIIQTPRLCRSSSNTCLKKSQCLEPDERHEPTTLSLRSMSTFSNHSILQ